ncbi:uncharacterized protein BJX67DRAFT_352058 [Aspergillus lucknowensis]|uniref:RING-type domain-containing protein n=1 Tax=Aspergillus lucknowensis TaxID=176173 RepID=A0ABR4LU69_9EURO
MVRVTFRGLTKLRHSTWPGTPTLDLPAQTRLADVASLLRGNYHCCGGTSFRRERQDGRRRTLYLGPFYDRKYATEKLEVSTDRPSSFRERCINVDDTFIYFASLEKGSGELTARLGDHESREKEKIIIDDRLELTFHRTLRMPDDDKIHPLPASRGTFPLYNVNAFTSQLPEHITKRGGVFFPMWQREALWINFNNRDSSTYYAIRVNIGHINAISGLDIYEKTDKQDYVVVPGQKWLDGIAVGPGLVRQFVAMPLGSGYTVEGQISGKECFGGIQIEIIPSYDEHRYKFTHEDTRGSYVGMDEHRTPRDYRLNGGDTVTMAAVPSGPRICDFLDGEESVGGMETIYLEVHCSCYPLSGGALETREIPLHSHPKILQEMGIAAGGKLVQDVVQDRLPKRIWNTGRARLVNIHILNPPDFEDVTHIVPPETPITTEEYLAASIPFFAVEEDPDQRLGGSTALAGVESISAMDEHVGVHDGSSTEFDPLKPKRCGTCAVRLCDCIIRPCNHQFCHMCIKAVASPGTSTQPGREGRRCPICSTGIYHIAGFSAPMNLPGEETFKVNVPVIMLEVEDGRAAFESVVEMRL